MKEPQARAEWQDAVNLAGAMELILSARAYGLIEGGPTIDERRVAEVLRRGFERGIEPEDGRVDEIVRVMVRGPG
jgi:hypothetical protein